jgi:HAD domain in Swiss Army Knife RNA repair proteins
MFILLDIDGVLVTTPSWKSVELLTDGFMKFNETAIQNLNFLCQNRFVEIVLTSTHRISYDEDVWKEIFAFRGLYFNQISKINKASTIENLKS